jgi:hypothetical protein
LKKITTAYSAGLGEASGPISRCEFRFEFGSKLIGFFAIVGLGITFLLNWVILKRLRFTQGYPMPMHIDGGCMCGDNFCQDVLFTFNVNIEDSLHNTTYHKKWMSTQYYDRDQKRKSMVAKAATLDDDRLVTQITKENAELIKLVKVGEYVQFGVTDVPHLLYSGLDHTQGHYVCETAFRGEEEFGSNWKTNKDTNQCKRSVALKLMMFNSDADPPYMRFAQTLAQLHFPVDGTSPVFVSPICKQGPQLFLAAGLRGAVTYEKINGIETDGGGNIQLFPNYRTVGAGAGAEDNEVFSSCNSYAYTQMADFCDGTFNQTGRRLSSPIHDDGTHKHSRRLLESLLPSNKRKLINSRMLASDYKEITSGSCSGDWEEISGGASACQSAMSSCSLCKGNGEDFISGFGKKSGSMSDGSAKDYPSGCYFYTSTCSSTKCKGNYYNPSGRSSCSSTRRCVCKKKEQQSTSTTSSASSSSSSSGGSATCTLGDCCTPNPCTPTHVENSDYSQQDSLKGNTGDTIQVTCNRGFWGKDEWNIQTATCGTDGTFNKITCCKHCDPPIDPFEWGSSRNVQCTKGTEFSGCNCADNNDGNQKVFYGQSCNEKKTRIYGFDYNRVGMTEDADCKLTSVEVDVCMVHNDVASSTNGMEKGAVFPASWYGRTKADREEDFKLKSNFNAVNNYCRANKMEFSILQLPSNDGTNPIKNLSHDHCWLTEAPLVVQTESSSVGTTVGTPTNSSRRLDQTTDGVITDVWMYDTTYQNEWGHKQTWHQVPEFDNSKMVWIGILLGTLCGIIAYIDFSTTFVPASHPLMARADVPMILAKMVTLMCCPCSKTYSWPIEDADAGNAKVEIRTKDEIKNWDLGADDEENAPAASQGNTEPMDDFGGKCGNREICSKRKSWIRSEDGGDFRSNLVYLLIQLPFNVMISCYTVVGTNFVNKNSGKVSGGVWALGSPVAIEMIEMPTIFVICIFSFIGAGVIISLVTVRKCNEKCFNRCSAISTGLIFLAWLGISVWIFIVNAQNVISNTSLQFTDIVFGISLPFQVPDVQLPTAYLSFSYGFIKLNLFLLGWIKKIISCVKSAPKKVVDFSNETGLEEGGKEEKKQIDVGGAVGTQALEAGKNKLTDTLKEKLKGAIDEQLQKEIDALQEGATQEDIDTLAGKINALKSNGSTESSLIRNKGTSFREVDI